MRHRARAFRLEIPACLGDYAETNRRRYAQEQHMLARPAERIKQLLSVLDRGLAYWLPILLLLLAALARVAVPDVLDRLSHLAFDLYQREDPRDASDMPVRIVDIDDHSLKTVGQWPWPRGTIAQLVDKLREAGAAVVVFDVLFSEPDRTSPKLLLPLLSSNGVSETAAEQLLAQVRDPDEVLAQAIAKMPVVLGFALTEKGGTNNLVTKGGFSFAGAAGADPLIGTDHFPEVVADLPVLQQAAAGNGAVNPHLDWDSVLRRVPLVFRLGADRAVPSLAAEALRLAVDAHGYIGKAAGANGEDSYGVNTGLNAVKIGPFVVPTDGGGMVWLHYARSEPSLYIPASDILKGKFDPEKIKDNIVLIGASAKGLQDLHPTPLSPDTPGTEIHAQLIEQVLQGSYLARPDWAPGAEAIFTLVIGLILVAAIPRTSALLSGAIGLVSIAIAMAASWYAFTGARMLFDPVYPMVVLGVVYIGTTLLSHRQTERRQREIRQAFSRYMSPHMVAELAKHPEKLKLGGEIKLITIMFCDIRGFTTLSEGLSAGELGQLINDFLTPMTEIITEHQGTIDKYIGDCIMAFWNAPLDDPDHAKNAVSAAQAMRRKLVELNEEWGKAGRRQIHIGIGVNTGECCVGNFGSQQRFDYSLLGDPVNLSSRLEGLTKQYGVDLVIGEDTAELLDDPSLIELDLVAVKGKSRAVRIYTILEHPIETVQFNAQHGALLAAYRRRDWNTALSMLEDETLRAEPGMAAVYDVFRDRIEQLQTDSPPEDWDGVYVAHEK
jgi:adenylate cyclase